MSLRLLIVSPIALAIACGGGEGGSAVDAPIDTAFTTGTYRATWGPYTVPPGDEGTKCVEVRLGNTANIQVNEIVNHLGPTSHHFIVYRKATGEPRTEPYDCQPFTGALNPANGSPLMITQRADETLTLPEGVVFTLQPDQLIRLELHYVNTTDAPIEVTATAEFRTLLGATTEADFIFAGTPDIDLPSTPGTQTVGPVYLPLPIDTTDLRVFAITGHTHKLGTAVRVETAETEDGPGTVVYDPATFSWDEPETIYHRPPFAIPQTGGFRFSCDYENTTGQRVGFGENANDEMCFFWLYYYPSRGAKVCAHTDQVNGGVNVCCPAAEGDAVSQLACRYIENGNF